MIQKNSISSAKTIVASICIIYSSMILLWFCLRWLLFDTLWPLAIVNTTIFYFFLPLPLLILAALSQRHKFAIVILIIPVCIFLFFWGGLLLPPISPTPNQDPSQVIQAMSYNVLFSNETPDALSNSITAASPDIVGLQELTPPIIDSLKSNLLPTYPHHTFDLFEPRGVGLLSRYPILSATKFTFPPRDYLALHAIVDWHGQLIHVFVVHFSANNFFDHPISQLPQLALTRYGQRANQIDYLQQELSVVKAPILLMCDCNLTDTSEVYSRLDLLLNDSYRAAGWGFGHTLQPHSAPFPLQRIDYVWHSNNFTAIDSYVGHAGGSDHHPVISTLVYHGQ